MLPLLSLIPLAVQAGTGIADLISSGKSKKRAHLPASIDSRQSQYLSELNNQRSNLSTGTAYRGFIDSLDKERANATEDLTNRTGGYYGAAIGGAQRLNEAYGDSLAKFGQNALGAENDIIQMEGNQINQMAGRKYNLEQQQYLQDTVDAKEKKQSGFGNLFAALEGVAGMDFGGKKTSPDDLSGLLKATAYDDVPDMKIDTLDSLDMGTDAFSVDQPTDAFADTFYNPKSFGNDFMKKKKYSLSY